MVDEIYDRGYQAGRADLHGGIDALIRKVWDGLAALAAVQHSQWNAPWNSRRDPKASA